MGGDEGLRERIFLLRIAYQHAIESLERSLNEIKIELIAIDASERAAKRDEERLVEKANTSLKGSGTVATTAAGGVIALFAKFGLIACPFVAVPILGGIVAGRALADRTETRRMFAEQQDEIDKKRNALETSRLRIERELIEKKQKANRVEELWQKVSNQ